MQNPISPLFKMSKLHVNPSFQRTAFFVGLNSNVILSKNTNLTGRFGSVAISDDWPLSGIGRSLTAFRR